MGGCRLSGSEKFWLVELDEVEFYISVECENDNRIRVIFIITPVIYHNAWLPSY